MPSRSRSRRMIASARYRVHELAVAGNAARIAQPREHQRVDPLAVGRPADMPGEGGGHVRREGGQEIREPRQVAVVRHGDGGTGELERVDVGRRDVHRRGIGDAAHVRDHRGGLDLFREPLQVAVEDRQPRRPVGPGPFRLPGSPVPRAQAEPGEVQHMQHLGHGGLPHERGIGLVEQVVQQDGLTEVEEGAAHGAHSGTGPGRGRAPALPAA